MRSKAVTRILALLFVLCLLPFCTFAVTGCKDNGHGGSETDTDFTDVSPDGGETQDPTGGEKTGNWIDYGTTPLAPTGHSTGNFDRTKFHIGVYAFDNALGKEGAFTETMIKTLSDCRIDIITNQMCDLELADMLQKYGLNFFYLEMPRGENLPAEILNHPACYGINLRDEPNSADLPGVGQRLLEIRDLFPDKISYVNLYPIQAGRGDVGNTYEGHLADYLDNIDCDYISYDNYPFTSGSDSRKWYANLITVAELCRENDLSLWVIAQGVGDAYYGTWWGINANQMRVQAYTAMAFGTEMLSWWLWAEPVSDAPDGSTLSTLYDDWKSVNTEILGFADEFMKYRSMSTAFVGFDGAEGWDIAGIADGVPSLSVGAFVDFRSTERGKKMVVGELAPRNGDGSSALMIADGTKFNGSSTATYEATFKVADSRTVKAYQGDTVTELLPDENGVYHLTVTPYAGILLVAERK